LRHDIFDIKEFEQMADLLVRGLDEAVVRALKRRAAAHGRSAEAEHREILASALLGPRRPNLAELLASMPNVGTDADFERIEGAGDPSAVFD
jgi:plasmid stability protein